MDRHGALTRPSPTAMIQCAIVVTAGPDGAPTPSLDALNERLRAGWRVAQASPMGGGGVADGFASLVVLERAVETEAEALLELAEQELVGEA